LGADKGGWAHRTYEVTFTNITHGVVLTPPIFALSPRQIDVFEVGEPASLALEKLAEGGITDDLRAEWEQIGLHDVVQTMDPVPPGQSITVELTGNHFSRLNLASMLLPTNDGYVAMNGPRAFQRLGKTTTYLMAYDAGTEVNDELCTSIPGPHCGGEGFNADGGEGFVVHHPGIHGEGDLSRQSYNWGEPVAKVTVRVSR
jgi:hypothetical protein